MTKQSRINGRRPTRSCLWEREDQQGGGWKWRQEVGGCCDASASQSLGSINESELDLLLGALHGCNNPVFDAGGEDERVGGTCVFVSVGCTEVQ